MLEVVKKGSNLNKRNYAFGLRLNYSNGVVVYPLAERRIAEIAEYAADVYAVKQIIQECNILEPRQYPKMSAVNP
jgi:hypothetical protein